MDAIEVGLFGGAVFGLGLLIEEFPSTLDEIRWNVGLFMFRWMPKDGQPTTRFVLGGLFKAAGLGSAILGLRTGFHNLEPWSLLGFAAPLALARVIGSFWVARRRKIRTAESPPS